jgi:serine/threonine protein kinase
MLVQGHILNNRYRIVKQIGQGGFGSVYRAWDLNLNRACAIKENTDFTESTQRQFEREAQVLSNLSHPNLVRVFDLINVPGQAQYLVMEYIDGEDLDSLLQREQRIDPARALVWIYKVCEALTYLHEQNPPIVHRDIKPANIRLTPKGEVVLVDFGLVKVFAGGQKTTVGARAVTPGYSPPEQYGHGTTDARTDVYALAATLYTLLTGDPPAESVLRYDDPTLPSISASNPAVSHQLYNVLAKGLDMKAGNRYQTIKAFQQALESAARPVAQTTAYPAANVGMNQSPANTAAPPIPAAPSVTKSLMKVIPYLVVVIGLMLLLLAYGLMNDTEPNPTPQVGVIGNNNPINESVLQPNDVVAVVNNEYITMSEFQSNVRFTRWQMIQEYEDTTYFMQLYSNETTFSQQIQAQLQQMVENLSDQNALALGADVLKAMIDDEVIRQEAVRRGISVTDEEVDRSIQEAFGFFIDGTPTPEVSSDLDPELSPTNSLPSPTPYTLEGFHKRLIETLNILMEDGITETDLRNVISMQILRGKLFDEITANVLTTEEQVWALHILVLDAETAERVVQRLDDGEDWSLVAAEESMDSSNANQGGDLGWFGRGVMVTEFEYAAYNTEIGEISGPVITEFGFHIIKVLGKEIRSLPDDQIQSRRQMEFQTWLENDKGQRDIKQFDNWSDNVPRTPVIPDHLLLPTESNP